MGNIESLDVCYWEDQNKEEEKDQKGRKKKIMAREEDRLTGPIYIFHR